MKMTLVFGVLAVLSTLSLYAQGVVGFRTITTPVDNRVRNPDGSLVTVDQGYRAQLMFAPDATPEEQFSNVALQIGVDAPVGALGPGVINSGNRTVPTDFPGDLALFQVRVWRLADGPNWAAVMATGNPNFLVAETPIMRVDTEEIHFPPPVPPLPIPPGSLTLHPVPEPSVILLALLGTAVLFVCRRRDPRNSATPPPK